MKIERLVDKRLIPVWFLTRKPRKDTFSDFKDDTSYAPVKASAKSNDLDITSVFTFLPLFLLKYQSLT